MPKLHPKLPLPPMSPLGQRIASLVSAIPMEPMTGEEFAQFRRAELRCSQATAAALLGVSVDTVRKWEQGVYPVSELATRLVCMILALDAPGEPYANR